MHIINIDREKKYLGQFGDYYWMCVEKAPRQYKIIINDVKLVNDIMVCNVNEIEHNIEQIITNHILGL